MNFIIVAAAKETLTKCARIKPNRKKKSTDSFQQSNQRQSIDRRKPGRKFHSFLAA
tara:strand:+ start:486 stop:653 length:168 start_codon:yes stop_codon:yes gene_type:complete